jgi:hypothetical protein
MNRKVTTTSLKTSLKFHHKSLKNHAFWHQNIYCRYKVYCDLALKTSIIKITQKIIIFHHFFTHFTQHLQHVKNTHFAIKNLIVGIRFNMICLQNSQNTLKMTLHFETSTLKTRLEMAILKGAH